MVKVVLDKERHLRYTLNSLERFEEVSGLHVMEMPDPRKMSIKQLKAFVWAGLIHEDKELTLEQLGEMIDAENMTDMYAAAGRAWATANEEKKDPLAGPGPSAGIIST